MSLTKEEWWADVVSASSRSILRGFRLPYSIAIKTLSLCLQQMISTIESSRIWKRSWKQRQKQIRSSIKSCHFKIFQDLPTIMLTKCLMSKSRVPVPLLILVVIWSRMIPQMWSFQNWKRSWQKLNTRFLLYLSNQHKPSCFFILCHVAKVAYKTFPEQDVIWHAYILSLQLYDSFTVWAVKIRHLMSTLDNLCIYDDWKSLSGLLCFWWLCKQNKSHTLLHKIVTWHAYILNKQIYQNLTVRVHVVKFG